MSTYPTPQRHHILSVLVQNKAGVLARVASLFARRGYNIFSLAVAPTEDPQFSRIRCCIGTRHDVGISHQPSCAETGYCGTVGYARARPEDGPQCLSNQSPDCHQ